jgi:hypothetical protein
LCTGMRVIEAWDWPTEVRDTPKIRMLLYSGEFYGEHISEARGARSIVSWKAQRVRPDAAPGGA